MLKNKIFSVTIALITAFTLGFTGCDNTSVTDSDTEIEVEVGTGTLEILLHDAPINYEEVNVFIESVEVNNSDSTDGWIEIGSPQQSYDLLKLTNGATKVLVSAQLEAGTYEQIRLILSSEGHNVVIDGTSHDMFIPSGEQTGIKLNVNAEIEPDITYTLLLDFDAARSVVKRGKAQSENAQSGVEYLLKPVISASNEAVTGNIAGIVEPADAQAFIYAIADSDTLSSTKADTTDGSFKLIGLEEGTYTVLMNPTNENYQSTDTTGVEVTIGETNDIGTITLSEN
ncbi:MAG: DUF4382 domain-containing protein [Gracilimonas sp.]|uniref:DUF4382 domain-containing protein n=1 Tax=Gracilimonas sp. TaxID=1974203 RepID=UPI0019A97924|nr:DUF4382 domain-containing protein [Gracilimonas sp.]MBD3615459.1 DUF4382 domain-containing protein [Gracilimonas sp.]